MKSLKYWASAVSVDVTCALLFYLWTQGSDGAMNVLLFFVWSISIIGIIASSQKDLIAKAAEEKPRPIGFTAYHYAYEAALCYALAWFGFFATAAIRLAMVLLFECAYKNALDDLKKGKNKDNHHRTY